MSTNIESSQNRKRRVAKLPDKISKKRKRSVQTHDDYCWKCHLEKADANCSKCLRAFHSSCFNNVSKLNKDGVCYVCVQQENVNFQSEVEISELLLQVFKAAMDKQQKPLDWQESATDERLCYNVDFRLIHDKCLERGMQYEYPFQLVEDIDWIHHNSIIVHGAKSEIVKTVKKVLKDVKQELNDALDCPECYLKKFAGGPAFVNICTPPHPLVWAKVKFHPYWPAKCLKVSKGKAHVRFFKTQQLSAIPISKCLSMSQDYPAEKKPDNVDFLIAEQQQQAYIDIFEDRYGDFPYDQKNTPFDYQKAEDTIKEIVKKHSNRKVLYETQKLLDVPTDIRETESPAEAVSHESSVSDEPAIAFHDVAALENVFSGRLLPTFPNQLSENFSGTSGISICNVVSGTELPSDLENDLIGDDLQGQGVPLMEEESTSGIEESNEDCESLRGSSRPRRDNRSQLLVEQFEDFMKLFFVKYWTMTSKSKNAERVIMKKEMEIMNLQMQLDERERKLRIVKEDHERALKSLANADILLKSYKNSLNSQREKYAKEVAKAKQRAEEEIMTHPSLEDVYSCQDPVDDPSSVFASFQQETTVQQFILQSQLATSSHQSALPTKEKTPPSWPATPALLNES